MSFAGRLEDVSFPELMQFVQTGGRSSTIWLRDESRVGTVTLHRGRIIGATAPSARPLGVLLVEQGLLDERGRAAALARQAATRPPRSLGAVLLGMGVVSTAALYGAVKKQVEESLYELIGWRRGAFEVSFDETELAECLSLPRRQLVRELNINIQAVLIEGLRRLDEGTAG